MEEKNKNYIIAVSVIATLYDNKRDLFQSFIPICEKAIHLLAKHISRIQIETMELREYIDDFYGIRFPVGTLRTILKKLQKRRGYITTYENATSFQIDAKHLEEAQLDFHNAEQEINILSKNIVLFALKSGENLTETEAMELLNVFLDRNKSEMSSFFAGTIFSEDSLREAQYEKSTRSKLNLIFEFIKYVKQERKKDYDVIKNLYFGSVISSLLENVDPAEISKKPQNGVLYIDTNFILRLLDWQTPEDHIAAIELHRLAISNNYSLYAYRITVDELHKALSRFLGFVEGSSDAELEHTLQKFRLGGLISAYQRKKARPSDLADLLPQIEEVLFNEFNIQIDERLKELEDYEGSQEFDTLRKLKNRFDNDAEIGLFKNSLNHDLTCIKGIKELRKKYYYAYNNARYWFLTSDYKLLRYNQKKDLGNKSVPETIGDLQLTNLLWLANPTDVKEAGLKHLILAFGARSGVTLKMLVDFNRHLEKYIKEHPDKIDKASLIYRNLNMSEEIFAANDKRSEEYQDESSYYYSVIENLIEKAEKESAAINLKENKLANEVNKYKEEVQNLRALSKEKDLELGEKSALLKRAHIDLLDKEGEKNSLGSKAKIWRLISEIFAFILFLSISIVVASKFSGGWKITIQAFALLTIWIYTELSKDTGLLIQQRFRRSINAIITASVFFINILTYFQDS
ncbi:MAG: hypothetical protein V3W18_13240 [candidate division Zixibacteria bacterium]